MSVVWEMEAVSISVLTQQEPSTVNVTMATLGNMDSTVKVKIVVKIRSYVKLTNVIIINKVLIK